MRIKRFIAPDMRTALRMVRDEQGPDAVILSNRPTDDGRIEVVAATDYDEALVSQALRAAVPNLQPAFASAPQVTLPAAAPAASAARSAPALASLLADPAPEQAAPAHAAPALAEANAAPAFATAATTATAAASRPASAARESLVSRARAVFKIGDGPTLAETLAAAAQANGHPADTGLAAVIAATARPQPAATIAPSTTAAGNIAADSAQRAAPVAAAVDADADADADAEPTEAPRAPTRFEAMMSALNRDADARVQAAPARTAHNDDWSDADGDYHVQLRSLAPPASPSGMPAAPIATTATGDEIVSNATASNPTASNAIASNGIADGANDASTADASADAVAPVIAATAATPAAVAARASIPATHASFDAQLDALLDDAPAVADTERLATAPRILHAIQTPQPDPTFIAMREELAAMRQLMERQMEQLSLERLRGSPGRAAAYDALLGYGCDEVLAQAVAAKLDARIAPADIHPPMFAALAGMLSIARSEPLDAGGVIALVGPTGAGKTTTVAKLAARYAARHRARDVAMVTTDGERAGAREQLHAHGRRLGITVCEAAGPEALQDVLAQLDDYPLVLVDTTGFAPRDRALFGQILWLRAARRVRSLLVLPANAHPHDLGEVIRRYRPAAPEGVVLTKLDETGRLGSALSVAVRHGLSLAYTTQGQQVPVDLEVADATRLAQTLEKLRRAADNPLATEDRHAHA